MNRAVRAAFVIPHAASHPSRAVSFFHSTPVLERKRKTQWNSRFNKYAKRMSKIESKRTLLRNISEYAEYLFQSWRDEDERNNTSAKDDSAWFRRQYWSKGSKLNGFSSEETEWRRYKNKRKGGFEFCTSDDDDAETIFRSAFEGERYYYWSFNNSRNFQGRNSSGQANHRSSWNCRYETDEDFQWRNSSGQANHRSSWNWRYETDEEDDTTPEPHLASERLVLGLSASGPLKLEEVKRAYRSCALRWHPDRHHGSSKVAAEEKFKHCSAAYKSLCEKLTMD